MADPDSPETKVESTARNPRHLVALLLSIIPGAGHLYKGHTTTGILFLVGTALAIFACGLIATFTMGLGLLLLPLYWIWVMTQAYFIEDLHFPDQPTV